MAEAQFPAACSDFILWALKEQIGITASGADGLFGGVPPPPASDFSRTLLKRHLLIVNSLGSEETRSGMIIAL